MEKEKQAVPTEIRYEKDEAMLYVGFDNDASYAMSAEYLRVFSPSAEVRGHGPDSAVLQMGKRDVVITGIEPVGNYAVVLRFDDGHDSGIYSWSWLQTIGEGQEENWAQYLKDLEAAGGKRGASKAEIKAKPLN